MVFVFRNDGVEQGVERRRLLSPFWWEFVVFTVICLAILLAHSSTGSFSSDTQQNAVCDLVTVRVTEQELQLNRSLMIIVNALIFLTEIWNALQLEIYQIQFWWSFWMRKEC